MKLASAIEAEAVVAEATMAQLHAQITSDPGHDLREEARAASIAANVVLFSPARSRPPATRVGETSNSMEWMGLHLRE